MKSIGSKIQTALVGSISIIAFCAFVILGVNQYVTTINRQIIDTMVKEYSIIALSEDMVQAYYNFVIRDTGNPEGSTGYNALRTKILNILKSMQKQVTSQDSRVALLGLDNSINQVISECDAGIAEMQADNYHYLSDHYSQAHKYNEFVSENTTTLLHKELQYLYQTQQSSQRIYFLTMVVAGGIFVVIFIVIILSARVFTKQLILPLTKLSSVAKDIANGNLQAMDEKSFKMADDETGSLAQSIHTMVNKLLGLIDQQKQANEDIKKATESLKEKNDELGRMNNLMVGRELKMTELKKELEDLKAKLGGNTPPQSPS
jgi:methyl-accepting chemotaxis protein